MINKKSLSGVTAPSRQNTNQVNFTTNNGIKQVFLVSAEELQDVINTLDKNIKSIKTGCKLDAIWSLTRLKENIENHLGGMD